MNKWQSLVSTVLGAACLVLAIAVVWAGQTTQQIQMQMQLKQNEINRTSRLATGHQHPARHGQRGGKQPALAQGVVR